MKQTAKKSHTTQRTLSVKVLVISLVAVSALAGTAYAVHTLQMRRTVEHLLDRATKLEQEEDYRKAAEYLHRYARLRPDDVAAKIRLAQTYDKASVSLQDKSRSIDLFYESSGLATGEQRQELRRRLAELLLETGRIAEAKSEAMALRESDAEDPVAHRVWAIASYSEYKADEVRADEFKDPTLGEIVQHAAKLNPIDIPLTATLARIYRREPNLFPPDSPIASSEVERNTRADDVIRQLNVALPDSPQAKLATFYYRNEFDLDGVQAALDEALKLGPNDLDVRLAASGYWMNEAAKLANSQVEDADGGAREAAASITDGLYRQAMDHLEHVIEKIDPKHEGAYVTLGEIYVSFDESDQAQDMWRRGITEIGEGALLLRLRLAQSLVDQGDNKAEAALASLDEAINKVDRTSGNLRKQIGPSRDLIEAALLIKRAKPGHAIALLEPIAHQSGVRPEQSQNAGRALAMLAHAYSELGRWDQAARTYDRLVSLSPNALQPRVSSAAAWLSAGQPQSAIKQYEYLLSKADQPQLRLLLAVARFQEQAKTPADERDWRRFRGDLAKLKSADSMKQLTAPWQVDFLEADYLAASAETREEGHQAAAALLRSTEERFANEESVFDGLAAVYERLGAAEDADRAIGRFEELTSQGMRANLQRANLLAGREQFQAAETLLQESLKTVTGSERRQAMELLSDLQLRQANVEGYQDQLVALHEEYPSRTNYLYQLAEIALRSEDYEQCKRWEAKIREVEGYTSALYRYFRARRLLAQSDSPDDLALNQIESDQQRIELERPEWAPAYELKGILEERRGRLASAATAYEAAIRLGDTRSSTYERLVFTLYQLRKFAEADVYLKKLSDQIPQSQLLSNLAMSVAAGLNDSSRAAAIAKQGVKNRPDDPTAWIWYGQMLLLNKDNDLAGEAFQKAIDLAPEDPQTWNGMFTYYLRTEQSDQARELIDALPKKIRLAAGEMAFVQAQAYELLEDRAAAAAKYAEAAKLMPDNFTLQMRIARFHHRAQPDLAEQALRHAVKLQPDSGPARRALAALLTDRGAWEEAKALLTSSGGGNASTVDQRVQAALLALRRSEDRVNDLESARRILEDIVRDSAAPADADNLLLALVYTELSRMQMSPAGRDQMVNNARRQYLALVSKSDVTTLPLTLFLRFLLEYERAEEAEPWLAKLEGIAPDTLETIGLRARWLHATGRDAEIEPLIRSAVEKAEGQPENEDERRQFYATIGRIYSSVEQRDAAISWYRKLHELEPNEYGALAQELAARGFVEEAMEVCKEAGKLDESARPATLAAAILATYGAPTEASRAGEPLLAKALSEYPEDDNLAMAIANLRVVQGQLGAAVVLYEQVVKSRPRDATALNNLATLLAEDRSRLEEALRYINRAVAIVGPRAALLDTKGTILIASSRSKEAVPILETAASFPNADPRYHFHLAVALDRMGETAQAQKFFRLAIDAELEKQILTSNDRTQLQELREKYEDL